MVRHQILIWFFCAVISGGLSTDSELEPTSGNIYAEYKRIQGKMLDLRSEVDVELKRLGRDTFTNLEKREIERLKNGSSECFQTWMSMLRTEIGSEMINECLAPCEEIFKEISDEIETQLVKVDEEVGQGIESVLNPKDDSITNTSQLISLRNKVREVGRTWSIYERNDHIRKWNRLTRCYKLVSNAVRDKLVELSIYAENCTQENSSYEKFIDQMGLLNFTIRGFIGPTSFSSEVSPLPYSEWLDILVYQEKSEIMSTLNSFRTLSQQIVGRMSSDMNSISNATLNNTLSSLITTFNTQTVAAENRFCYRRTVLTEIAKLTDYLTNNVTKFCFNDLIDARNEFNNIDQCDLQLFKERLSRIHNCWATQRDCLEIAAKLEGLENLLDTWQNFVSTIPFGVARDCFSGAQTRIIDGVTHSLSLLRTCQAGYTPNLSEMKKPVYSYPPYQKASFCSPVQKHT